MILWIEFSGAVPAKPPRHERTRKKQNNCPHMNKRDRTTVEEALPVAKKLKKPKKSKTKKEKKDKKKKNKKLKKDKEKTTTTTTTTTTTVSDIDDIFGNFQANKEIREKKRQKEAKKAARRARVEAEELDKLQPRKDKDSGFNVYTEDQLSILNGSNKHGGNTALCPFDCNCCF